MDKNHHSSSYPSSDHKHLKQLNKLSHKISKKPLFEPPRPQPMQHPQQPPVYNIDKKDFREVVQRLTGLPAQERLPSPQIQAPKPPSSRLQRIRPPPLAPITNRPIEMAPLSPLPPLPAVHVAAESPVSAYMRYLKREIFSDEPSPKELVQQPHGGNGMQAQLQAPLGCSNSPFFSPSMLFSPANGVPQVPMSPTVHVPNPDRR